jgi:hypothetical protein
MAPNRREIIRRGLLAAAIPATVLPELDDSRSELRAIAARLKNKDKGDYLYAEDIRAIGRALELLAGRGRE